MISRLRRVWLLVRGGMMERRGAQVRVCTRKVVECAHGSGHPCTVTTDFSVLTKPVPFAQPPTPQAIYGKSR